MSDDGDDYVLFGSKFTNPKTQGKIKHVQDEIVTDDEGRRRFHGAFTGGFSAGYYNSVGSKEGFTPSTFTSSKSKRQAVSSGTADMYMDEEDISAFGIAPKNIGKSSEYNEEASKSTDSILSIMTVNRDSKGVRLMKAMGWKPGFGVGPRKQVEKKEASKSVYSCQPPPGYQKEDADEEEEEEEDMYTIGLYLAPKDYAQYMLKPHPTTRGIDYIGISGDAAPSSRHGNTVAGFSGEAFGIGALEEGDEYSVYNTDDKSNYTSTLEEDGDPGDVHLTHKFVTTKKDYLSNFAVGKMDKYLRKNYPPPAIPPGFKPWHNPSSGSINTEPSTNIQERAVKLGISDFDRPAPPQPKSTSTAKTEEFTSSDNKDKKPGKAYSLFRPFKDNSAKEERYNIFQRGEPMDYSTVNMTDWERERETEEFVKSSNFFKPLSFDMANRFASAGTNVEQDKLKELEKQAEKERSDAVKMKMFGQLTRETHQWIPASLLCKRFDVANPYPDIQSVGTIRRFSRIVTTTTTTTAASSSQVSTSEDPRAVTQHIDNKRAPRDQADCSEPATVGSGEDERKLEEKIGDNIDLFKSVFADSEDEESEDEKEDEKPLSSGKTEDNPSENPLTGSEANAGIKEEKQDYNSAATSEQIVSEQTFCFVKTEPVNQAPTITSQHTNDHSPAATLIPVIVPMPPTPATTLTPVIVPMPPTPATTLTPVIVPMPPTPATTLTPVIVPMPPTPAATLTPVIVPMPPTPSATWTPVIVPMPPTPATTLTPVIVPMPPIPATTLTPVIVPMPPTLSTAPLTPVLVPLPPATQPVVFNRERYQKPLNINKDLLEKIRAIPDQSFKKKKKKKEKKAKKEKKERKKKKKQKKKKRKKATSDSSSQDRSVKSRSVSRSPSRSRDRSHDRSHAKSHDSRRSRSVSRSSRRSGSYSRDRSRSSYRRSRSRSRSGDRRSRSYSRSSSRGRRSRSSERSRRRRRRRRRSQRSRTYSSDDRGSRSRSRSREVFRRSRSREVYRKPRFSGSPKIRSKHSNSSNPRSSPSRNSSFSQSPRIRQRDSNFFPGNRGGHNNRGRGGTNRPSAMLRLGRRVAGPSNEIYRSPQHGRNQPNNLQSPQSHAQRALPKDWQQPQQVIETQRVAPEPAITQRVAPEPAITQRVAPEPAITRRVAPEPAITRRVAPEPARTQMVAPEPAITQRVAPELAITQRVAPEPAITQRVAPEPARTQRVAPEPARTQRVAPEPIRIPEPSTSVEVKSTAGSETKPILSNSAKRKSDSLKRPNFAPKRARAIDLCDV